VKLRSNGIDMTILDISMVHVPQPNLIISMTLADHFYHVVVVLHARYRRGRYMRFMDVSVFVPFADTEVSFLYLCD